MRSTNNVVSDGDSVAFARRGGRVSRKRRRRRVADGVETSAAAARSASSGAASWATISRGPARSRGGGGAGREAEMERSGVVRPAAAEGGEEDGGTLQIGRAHV